MDNLWCYYNNHCLSTTIIAEQFFAITMDHYYYGTIFNGHLLLLLLLLQLPHIIIKIENEIDCMIPSYIKTNWSIFKFLFKLFCLFCINSSMQSMDKLSTVCSIITSEYLFPIFVQPFIVVYLIENLKI